MEILTYKNFRNSYDLKILINRKFHWKFQGIRISDILELGNSDVLELPRNSNISEFLNPNVLEFGNSNISKILTYQNLEFQHVGYVRNSDVAEFKKL